MEPFDSLPPVHYSTENTHSLVTKNQIRVDATLRFDLEGYLEGNESKTNFSFKDRQR